jgi:hypothetical protein
MDTQASCSSSSPQTQGTSPSIFPKYGIYTYRGPIRFLSMEQFYRYVEVIRHTWQLTINAGSRNRGWFFGLWLGMLRIYKFGLSHTRYLQKNGGYIYCSATFLQHLPSSHSSHSSHSYLSSSRTFHFNKAQQSAQFSEGYDYEPM